MKLAVVLVEARAVALRRGAAQTAPRVLGVNARCPECRSENGQWQRGETLLHHHQHTVHSLSNTVALQLLYPYSLSEREKIVST